MSFLPKPGEDRKIFIQLVIAGFFFAITKILYETSPTLGIVTGGVMILGLICYFSYRFIKFMLSKQNITGVIKKNERKTPLILLVLLLLILLAGWFYWFQYRPAQIKHGCSWVKRHSDAVPARPAMTEAELRAKGIIKDCNKDIYNDSFSSNIDRLCQDGNKMTIEEYKQAKPAEPAKDWLAAASGGEYQFCLRDKGL